MDLTVSLIIILVGLALGFLMDCLGLLDEFKNDQAMGDPDAE